MALSGYREYLLRLEREVNRRREWQPVIVGVVVATAVAASLSFAIDRLSPLIVMPLYLLIIPGIALFTHRLVRRFWEADFARLTEHARANIFERGILERAMKLPAETMSRDQAAPGLITWALSTDPHNVVELLQRLIKSYSPACKELELEEHPPAMGRSLPVFVRVAGFSLAIIIWLLLLFYASGAWFMAGWGLLILAETTNRSALADWLLLHSAIRQAVVNELL